MKRYRIWIKIGGRRIGAVICPVKIFGWAVFSVVVMAAFYQMILAIPSHATTLFWRTLL